MQKIGQGWQYVVYDLGNGRVLKKKYSNFSKFFFIRTKQIAKGQPYSMAEIIRSIYRVNKKALQSIQYFKINQRSLDFKLIANPKFLNGINYEQDKITSLSELFKSCSISEGKELFNKYTKFIHSTWRYGFSDTIFNFLGNNGIDENGLMVQSDFGELAFSKKEVKKLIENKKWLNTSCFHTFPEGELKAYFKMLMEKEITEENLERFFSEK